MTPPGRRHVHPRLGPLVVAFEAPDCPTWAEDDRGLVAPSGPPATPAATGVRLLVPAARVGPRRRKKDPHPDQIALIDTKGKNDDGKYD